MAEPAKYLGETVAVKEAHRFDERRLDEYLHGAIPGYAGPLSVKQFEGGQSNPTYLLSTPTRKYVMRRKPPGQLLKSAHAVDREFRVIRALGATGFPVPQALVLCDDETVAGTMFYVMSYVPGRVFLDCTLPDLTPPERTAVFDSIIDTLARLHTFDPAALGLADFGRPGNYFSRQVARWSQQYESSKTEDIPEMDKLIAWLPGAMPADDGRSCLIHGDYSFHNVLVHPMGTQVVGVLDWELSTIGHPLGDLMYHLMAWYRPPELDTRGALRDADLASLGIPSFKASIARYAERSGYALPDNLGFYRAYNLFRVGAIWQGIAGRVRDGTAAAADAAQLAARVRPIAIAAWAEARAAGAV